MAFAKKFDDIVVRLSQQKLSAAQKKEYLERLRTLVTGAEILQAVIGERKDGFDWLYVTGRIGDLVEDELNKNEAAHESESKRKTPPQNKNAYFEVWLAALDRTCFVYQSDNELPVKLNNVSELIIRLLKTDKCLGYQTETFTLLKKLLSTDKTVNQSLRADDWKVLFHLCCKQLASSEDDARSVQVTTLAQCIRSLVFALVKSSSAANSENFQFCCKNLQSLADETRQDRSATFLFEAVNCLAAEMGIANRERMCQLLLTLGQSHLEKIDFFIDTEYQSELMRVLIWLFVLRQPDCVFTPHAACIGSAQWAPVWQQTVKKLYGKVIESTLRFLDRHASGLPGRGKELSLSTDQLELISRVIITCHGLCDEVLVTTMSSACRNMMSLTVINQSLQVTGLNQALQLAAGGDENSEQPLAKRQRVEAVQPDFHFLLQLLKNSLSHNSCRPWFQIFERILSKFWPRVDTNESEMVLTEFCRLYKSTKRVEAKRGSIRVIRCFLDSGAFKRCENQHVLTQEIVEICLAALHSSGSREDSCQMLDSLCSLGMLEMTNSDVKPETILFQAFSAHIPNQYSVRGLASFIGNCNFDESAMWRLVSSVDENIENKENRDNRWPFRSGLLDWLLQTQDENEADNLLPGFAALKSVPVVDLAKLVVMLAEKCPVAESNRYKEENNEERFFECVEQFFIDSYQLRKCKNMKNQACTDCQKEGSASFIECILGKVVKTFVNASTNLRQVLGGLTKQNVALSINEFINHCKLAFTMNGFLQRKKKTNTDDCDSLIHLQREIAVSNLL